MAHVLLCFKQRVPYLSFKFEKCRKVLIRKSRIFEKSVETWYSIDREEQVNHCNFERR